MTLKLREDSEFNEVHSLSLLPVWMVNINTLAFIPEGWGSSPL